MTSSSDEPTIIDKRTSSGGKLEYGKLQPEPDNTARGNTRLSNVRWPLGQEPYPDVEGTDKDDGWVNVKMEVVEHPDPDPNQLHLLHGGAELKINCFHCGEPLHIAATMDAKELLEEGGYRFPDGYVFPKDRTIVACVCENAHVVQFREPFVRPLIK